jgi:HPt (histidine-containing phosphotransfer) domain-containing protein
MDGFAASWAIRVSEEAQALGHLPIVALTANAIAGDRERCLAAGMDDYLSKPFDRKQLRDVLRRWLPAQAGGTSAAARDSEGEEVVSGLRAEEKKEVFDRDGLLERLGDGEYLHMFVLKFIESSADLMAALDREIEAQNSSGIHLQSHSIKGASAGIGAETMRTIAAQMEAQAKEGDLSGLPVLYAELQEAFTAFKAFAPDRALQQ